MSGKVFVESVIVMGAAAVAGYGIYKANKEYQSGQAPVPGQTITTVIPRPPIRLPNGTTVQSVTAPPVHFEANVEGRIVKDQPAINKLHPEDAYSMVHAGRHNEIFGQKISRYFTWGEVFSSDTMRAKNRFKLVPKSAYYKAEKMAQWLDKIREAMGKPLSVYSWLRDRVTNNEINASKRHEEGSAIDFAGTYYQNKAILDTALRLGFPGAYGIADGPGGKYSGKFHMDLKDKNRWKYNRNTGAWY